MLALFYDSHGNEIRAEHAFLEAHRLNILAAVKKHEAEKAAERSSDMHSVSEQGGRYIVATVRLGQKTILVSPPFLLLLRTIFSYSFQRPLKDRIKNKDDPKHKQ